MKYALAIAVSIVLCGPVHARTSRHVRHYHHRHHTHSDMGARAAHAGLDIFATAAGPIRVAAAYAGRFVGFINALVDAGYKPKEIGCYARGGHMPHSKHYRGLACDIDQDDRNVTTWQMHDVTALAHEFKLTDGCEWRHPDCGHVEVSN